MSVKHNITYHAHENTTVTKQKTPQQSVSIETRLPTTTTHQSQSHQTHATTHNSLTLMLTPSVQNARPIW
jgi:hypothetical protein